MGRGEGEGGIREEWGSRKKRKEKVDPVLVLLSKHCHTSEPLYTPTPKFLRSLPHITCTGLAFHKQIHRQLFILHSDWCVCVLVCAPVYECECVRVRKCAGVPLMMYT